MISTIHVYLIEYSTTLFLFFFAQTVFCFFLEIDFSFFLYKAIWCLVAVNARCNTVYSFHKLKSKCSVLFFGWEYRRVIRTHLDFLAALPITVLQCDSLCLFPTVNYPSKYWNRASKDELKSPWTARSTMLMHSTGGRSILWGPSECIPLILHSYHEKLIWKGLIVSESYRR